MNHIRQISLAGILVMGLSGAPAFAMTCEGNYQIVDGKPIATPYCRDDTVARVARLRGVQISSTAVRNDPGSKQWACRRLGDDLRTQRACDALDYGTPSWQ